MDRTDLHAPPKILKIRRELDELARLRGLPAMHLSGATTAECLRRLRKQCKPRRVYRSQRPSNVTSPQPARHERLLFSKSARSRRGGLVFSLDDRHAESLE